MFLENFLFLFFKFFKHFLKISWELAQAFLYLLPMRIVTLSTSRLLVKDQVSCLWLILAEVYLNIPPLKLHSPSITDRECAHRAEEKIYKEKEPWLAWLSRLSAGLKTKRSLVRFPVRAHAWVWGQVPGWGHMRDNHTLMFLSLSFSLPSSLSQNK